MNPTWSKWSNALKNFGVDHVGFGLDTLRRPHSAIQNRSPQEQHDGDGPLQEAGRPEHRFLGMAMKQDEFPDYVKGMENPNEAIHNAIRWLIHPGYSDEEIAKMAGLNAFRVLKEVWKPY